MCCLPKPLLICGACRRSVDSLVGLHLDLAALNEGATVLGEQLEGAYPVLGPLLYVERYRGQFGHYPLDVTIKPLCHLRLCRRDGYANPGNRMTHRQISSTVRRPRFVQPKRIRSVLDPGA